MAAHRKHHSSLVKHHHKEEAHHEKLMHYHKKQAERMSKIVELNETHHPAKKRGRPAKKGAY